MVLCLALTLGAFLVTPANATPGGHHAVSGSVLLDDGAWFQIDAQRTDGAVLGKAWLVRAAAAGPVIAEITIDCLEVSYESFVYPFPPYTPFHVARASGATTDGDHYYITAIDTAGEHLGFGDRLSLDTETHEEACGAPSSVGVPIGAGEIVVAP